MAFDLGMHTTLKDVDSKLDPEVLAITERITPMLAREFGRVWELFTTRGTPFTTDEYEILSRNYTVPEVKTGASGTNVHWDSASATEGMPINSGYTERLIVGDILLVNDEIVVVKTIDRVANTVDLYERGAGETTAARHGEAAIDNIPIIGNAHLEGTVDVTAAAEQTGKVSNYCQIVLEEIDLSKADTDQARKVGRTRDVLMQEAMERVIRDLARSAIYGTARAGTAAYPAMTRGLLAHLEHLAGAIKTAVSGAFTEAVLKNELDDVRGAGGTINAIVMSVANKRIFNGFTGADQIQVDRGERLGGHVLDGYIADGFGTIPAVVDIDFPDDKVALINTRFMQKGWKINDLLRFVPEVNTHSRQNVETLQGKFGLAVEGVGRTHGLLTGLTT